MLLRFESNSGMILFFWHGFSGFRIKTSPCRSLFPALVESNAIYFSLTTARLGDSVLLSRMSQPSSQISCLMCFKNPVNVLREEWSECWKWIPFPDWSFFLKYHCLGNLTQSFIDSVQSSALCNDRT